mmetsp:Transcript_12595/g.16353  ORF Transcript_12595/g.16353 Transcript_12595/m.16353 type:complete len:136 (+) Transcript_12595:190-597(+)
MVFQYLIDLKASYELSRVEKHECSKVIENRRKCERLHGFSSKGHEECVHEELAEKKCLACSLCKEEYMMFYGHGQNQTACATLVEKFKQNLKSANDLQLNGATETKKVKIPRRCRDASYALGHCLHKYTKTAKDR